MCFLVVALLVLAPAAFGIEIATGRMLGSKYDARAFYVRRAGGQWQKTYAGTGYRPEAAGRLMNLRVAQAVVHDEWLTEAPFDAQKNTERVVAALDTYKAHGVLAISVSLQGANQAYERTPGIKRTRDAKLGPERGALMSAYRADGSIKPEWLRRTLLLARELDRRGMILNLIYLYCHQDEVFQSSAAIDRAVRDTTDWLIDNNLRNVIIEVANEHDNPPWDHDGYVRREIGRLIEMARERFVVKKSKFRLPITASTGGGMKVFDGTRDHADLIIIHGNEATPEQKRARVAELINDPRMPGPIYMNEDDNGRETTPANLQRELASLDAVLDPGGAGWGFMPWVQLQIWPFRIYMPNGDPADRDSAYFQSVLTHIRNRVRQGAL
jgi:hypothetical protein